MPKLDNRKFWLVKHPISKHYEETQDQVKELARRANLRIRDAKFPVADEFLAKDTPKLTENGKKKKAPAKAKAPAKSEAPEAYSGE